MDEVQIIIPIEQLEMHGAGDSTLPTPTDMVKPHVVNRDNHLPRVGVIVVEVYHPFDLVELMNPLGIGVGKHPAILEELLPGMGPFMPGQPGIQVPTLGNP